MTQENKELLLKDLCSRLPYGVKVQYKGNIYDLTEMHKDGRTYLGSYNSIYGDWHCCFEFDDYPKPYLRPMSSMTEEEKEELIKNFWGSHTVKDTFEELSWYLSKHFDINELIPRGLAIEVTEENNPYEDRKYSNTKAY